MKAIITIITIAFMATAVHAKTLLQAISRVESNDISTAVGDKGKAAGAYQIHKSYVDDVNRIYGTRFTYQDRYDNNKAKIMVILYLRYYGARYERLTGNKATPWILARIHNGGPNGWKKEATIAYADKVVKEMNND